MQVCNISAFFNCSGLYCLAEAWARGIGVQQTKQGVRAVGGMGERRDAAHGKRWKAEGRGGWPGLVRTEFQGQQGGSKGDRCR